MSKPQIIKAWQWDFRFLPQSLSQLGVKVEDIIHVGAHWGEEVPVYLQCGFQSITLVEPDPEACDKITSQDWYDSSRINLLNLAVGKEEGEFEFHRIENGIWSGFKQNMDHRLTEIITVPTVPLSALQRNFKANVLVIDTQGTELEVLQSADLSKADLIIIETQNMGRESYAAYWPDLIHFVEANGWEPAIVWDRRDDWTDTLLVPRR